MANEVMLRHTNAQLMDVAQRKDSKKKRRKGHFTGGRVMNQEVLDERREIWDWDTIWKSLAEISRDIFGRQKIKKTRAQRLAKRVKSPAKRVLKPSYSTPRKEATSRAQAQDRPATPILPTLPKRYVQATPERDGAAITTGRRAHKLLVRLAVRVTTQELKQGRWRQQYEARDQSDDAIGSEQLGRGLRTRRPRRVA